MTTPNNVRYGDHDGVWRQIAASATPPASQTPTRRPRSDALGEEATVDRPVSRSCRDRPSGISGTPVIVNGLSRSSSSFRTMTLCSDHAR
jgi:hypothetical protein